MRIRRKKETNPLKRKRKQTMDNQARSDLEQEIKSEMRNAKNSDSGYSTTCSNSQSHRSGSSKSFRSNSVSSNCTRHYGGFQVNRGKEFSTPRPSKSSWKIKEEKRKKIKFQEEDEGELEIQKGEGGETEDKFTGANSNVAGKNSKAAGKIFPTRNLKKTDSPFDDVTTSNNQSKTGSERENPTDDGEIKNGGIVRFAAAVETLKCVKNMRNYDGRSKPDLRSRVEFQESTETLLSELKKESCGSREIDGFSVAASLKDGKVLYATSTIADVLGFPSDMWIGRSFVDFLREKDRIPFADHVTIALGKTCRTEVNKFFFCCLRKYRGLKNSGFAIKDKSVEYRPFKLSFSFRKIVGEISDNFLVITAETVRTAYQHPDELKESPRFVTRHSSDTILSHVDGETVSHLGYLPQDMIGRSILDFYHPEDLILLKEVYDSAAKVRGSTFQSKPYRLRTQNGGFVLLETEWSSFVNPWSNKLEFTTGRHRLLRGPPNPDVFATPTEREKISEEVSTKKQIIQEEISKILSESFCGNPKSDKRLISKRCEQLAKMMVSMGRNMATTTEQEKSGRVQRFSKTDSIGLGEISPHEDLPDSKSSSETPPNYDQLNYSENLRRFFDSKPKTLSEKEENFKISFHPEEERKASFGKRSGLSSAASKCAQKKNVESKQPEIWGPPLILTESALCRHNADIEKILIKKHLRRNSRVENEKSKEIRRRTATEKFQNRCHGIKRNGSSSWKSNKMSKHKRTEPETGRNPHEMYYSNEATSRTVKGAHISVKRNLEDPGVSRVYHQQERKNVTLWSKLPETIDFNQSTPHCEAPGTSRNVFPVSGMIPIYYIATGDNPPTNVHHHGGASTSGSELQATNKHPGPAGPLLMGVQFFPVCQTGSPFVYSSMMMGPHSTNRTRSHVENKTKNKNGKESKMMRASSGETSVGAEPGSVTGDMMVSESPEGREEKSIGSTAGEDSSLSQNGENAKEISELSTDLGTVTGNDSNSSSYSLFLKTDNSMRSSEETESEFSRSREIKRENTAGRPRRKVPPWLEKINVTPELIFRYQLNEKDLTSVLESDLKVLRATQQPKLVDEQLQQLYVDLELEGSSPKLKFEERLTSSTCSSSEEQQEIS